MGKRDFVDCGYRRMDGFVIEEGGARGFSSVAKGDKQYIEDYGKRSIGVMARPTGGYKTYAFEQRLVRRVPEGSGYCRLSCGVKGCSGPAGLLRYMWP